ncbi:MAG: glycolate oxidase subunit GlcE [Acidithiobacillus sp.]
MDCSAALREQLREACAKGQKLEIRGSGSKTFYGRPVRAEGIVDVHEHIGILAYEPSELFLTARAGTPLREIDAALAERGQMLPFEPPRFGAQASIGGTVACGFSGPRRPYAGAVKDHILGVRILNGLGEDLHFGGTVLKNVAGYDVARLMAGSLGSLALILEVTVKVLPRPTLERTLVQECSADQALQKLRRWMMRSTPISASAHYQDTLYLRLSGQEHRVRNFAEQSGGEILDDDRGARFWEDLREQGLDFFCGDAPLWRLSLPAAAPQQPADFGASLWEWGGQQRWLRAVPDPLALRHWAQSQGGHATLFRATPGAAVEIFQELPPPLFALHQRLKAAFDPKGILNPGRLYAGL